MGVTLGNKAAAKPKSFDGVVEETLHISKKDGKPSLSVRGADGKRYRVLSFNADGSVTLNTGNQKSGWPTDTAGRIKVAA